MLAWPNCTDSINSAPITNSHPSTELHYTYTAVYSTHYPSRKLPITHCHYLSSIRDPRIDAHQYNELSYCNAMLPLMHCDKCTDASQLSQLHIIQILTKLQVPRFDIWLHCTVHKINLRSFHLTKDLEPRQV